VTPLLVTSVSIIHVLEKTSFIQGLLQPVWELVNNDLISDETRQEKMFLKIDSITMQLTDTAHAGIVESMKVFTS
jgi:hypothetical protein